MGASSELEYILTVMQFCQNVDCLILPLTIFINCVCTLNCVDFVMILWWHTTLTISVSVITVTICTQ